MKTGGCPEDCAYCPQSAHYSTEVSRGGLLPVDEVVEFAERARSEGATRFCMGAAWREVQDGEDFENVLEMVRRVAELGMEVCCSLGMLDDSQAERLADAGLTAYNHNLDTSPGVLRPDHHDAQLRRPPAHARVGAKSGNHRLLRRHHRPGRIGRTIASACCTSFPRSIRIRKACPSMRWCASPGLRSNIWTRSIRWSLCARLRRRES